MTQRTIKLTVAVDAENLREWAGRHADAGNQGVAHVLYAAAEVIDDMPGTAAALNDVLQERARQHQLYGDQSHLPMGEVTTLDRQRLTTARRNHDHAVVDGTLTFRHILDEEFCEVLAAETITEMRAELIQVAALCQQVLEAIDKKAAGT